MKLRTLVVDDEPVARRLLCSMVTGLDWLELAGEARDGRSATEMIDATEPDLVFLDIKLPDISGLDVLERTAHRPQVVFTTAHDEFAIRALQLGALDYILKPFSRRRFEESAHRVRARLSATTVPGRIDVSAHDEWVFVRDQQVAVPIAIDQVSRIEARGDYAVLHVDGRALPTTIGLGELEQSLDTRHFVRVHRSHIVHLRWVASLTQYDERRLLVTLKDGFRIIASRAGSRRLKAMIL